MFWILLLVSVASKSVTTTLTLSPELNWKYVSKFAVDIGKGSWEMKAKLAKPLDANSSDRLKLVTSVYLDDFWEDALYADSCISKTAASKREKYLKVPLNGEWSSEISGILSQRLRPHVWYFSVSDCDQELTEKIRLKVEMHFLNADESEFSLEDKGMVYLFPVMMVAYLAALSGNLLKLIKKFQKTEDLEPNLLMLNLAVGCQFCGICCEILHLWIYAYNGKGLPVFNFFYQILEVMSGLMVTIMFIIMASGWTLVYRDFPDADVYIPVSLLVVLLNLLVVGIGRVTDDAYYKFSDYEGIPGLLLIFMRLGMWGWFLYLVWSLQSSLQGKKMSFVLNFSILASVYFLAQPFLVVFSLAFVNYWRNTIVVVGTTCIQTSVFFFLSHLFSEKSTYYKISTMSESVLPGKMH